MQLQGISEAIAFSYFDAHGGVSFDEIGTALRDHPACPKLASYWNFSGCGFRKAAWTCAETTHLQNCSLPMLPLRKGALNQAAYSLFFFTRDVCDGDFVGWVDERLLSADSGTGSPDRGRRMRQALFSSLRNVVGVSDKLWSMILAALVRQRREPERWVTMGTSLIAIDSPVHAFLHRTGILRRPSTEHPYGDSCYAAGGCSDIIEGLAAQLEASEF